MAKCNAEETIILYLYNCFPASASHWTTPAGSFRWASAFVWFHCLAVSRGRDILTQLPSCKKLLDQARLPFNKRSHPTGITTLPLFGLPCFLQSVAPCLPRNSPSQWLEAAPGSEIRWHSGQERFLKQGWVWGRVTQRMSVPECL